MEFGEAGTNEKALDNLRSVRSYKPYQYGGTWHVAAVNGKALAYRNARDLLNRARKEQGDAYAGLSYLTVKFG